MSAQARADRWFVLGDLNGFFGLMFDNVAVISFLAGTLIVGFNFPADIVYTRMVPGTTFGVLVGDLFYTWMAWRLGKRIGRKDVTAMPLGLDTPSTIGLAVAVLGPAFLAFKNDGYAVQDAALMTWYLGMATMVFIGIVKVILSFCGSWVQRVVPRAGLLGSLAGVGLALIGFIPLVDVFGMPVVGMLSLGLVLYTLVARISLPKRIPGLPVAVLLGTLLYHILHLLGYGVAPGAVYAPPTWQLHFGLPVPTMDFIQGVVPALKYLPIAIPFAILTVVGGINVTESARVAGDTYDTRQILLGEAVATLVAGLCGGVAQSCPYIGHPAYKRMGARLGYTLLTGGLHRTRGCARVRLVHCRADSPRGVGAHPGVYRPGNHRPGLYEQRCSLHACGDSCHTPEHSKARGYSIREPGDRFSDDPAAPHDESRPDAPGSTRDRFAGERIHSHGNALGRIPGRDDRWAPPKERSIPGNPRGLDPFRPCPLFIPECERLSALDVDWRVSAGAVPVRIIVRAAGFDDARSLFHRGKRIKSQRFETDE